MRSPLRHLANATLVVLASACGNGSNGQEAASQEVAIADPCSLLAPAEVGDALGTPVTAGAPREATSGGTRATICIFDGGWPNNVNLTVRQGGGSSSAIDSEALAAELNKDIDDMEANESMSGLVEGGRWQPLDLPGHAAAVRDAGEGGWTVAVYAGGRSAVQVLVNAPTREAGVKLAGLAMSRIPG